jgi:hypothetical protein
MQQHTNGRIVRRDEFAAREAAVVSEYQKTAADSVDLGHYLPLDPQRHYAAATRIVAIRPPVAADQSLWEVDLVERWPGAKHEVTRHLRFDAAADWLVVRDRHESAGGQGEGRFTLGTIFDRAAAIVRDIHNVDETGREWKTLMRSRELNDAEASQVREKVEAVVRLQPTRDWHENLRPLMAGIAWPTSGMFLLCVGAILRRCESAAA